jgi:DNA-binding NarL/FixJ family response regulator
VITSISKKNEKSKLTDRELEVLRFICCGLSNEQIAEKLHLSFDTIKWHRSNLLGKTGCKNTAQLIIHSIRANLIEL